MEQTTFIGDGNASVESNWDNGLPDSTTQVVIPDGVYCHWDIADLTIPMDVEGVNAHITIDDRCFFGGECYAPEAIVTYIENTDRPPPGHIGIGDKDYKYSVFQQKWIKLFPDGLQAGATNQWSNAGLDTLYSNGNNWSLTHKPAPGEDILIPDTSGIGKCTMDENSAADLGSFEVQASGEFEDGGFILDVDGNVILTGTYTNQTGTLQLGGGIVQQVTTTGNVLYHVIVTGASTIYYTVDDTEIFDIDVQAGATFEVDAVTQGAPVSILFSDIANAGMLASAGNFLCQGDGVTGVTITAANPGSNPWDFFTSMDITADYTTFSYYDRGITGSSTIDIDNCTFDNADDEGWYYTGGVTQTSFDNNTISNSGDHGFVNQQPGPIPTIDNLTITNVGVGDWDIYCLSGGAQKMEFTNSRFDETNVGLGGTDAVISVAHNDVANAWLFIGGATNAYVKSTITNDYVSTDNVTLYSGTLVVDEASTCRSVDVQAGTTFKIDAVGAGASLTHTFASSGGFGASVGQLTGVGDITDGVTIDITGGGSWDANTNMDITADYTTFDTSGLFQTDGTWDIDNCNFINGSSVGVIIDTGSTVTSFNDNTIDNCASGAFASRVEITASPIDNLTIGTHTAYSIGVGRNLEFTNSTFDASLAFFNVGSYYAISDTHNKVANSYYIMMDGTHSKSDFVIDFGATDNVTLNPGTGSNFVLEVDEAIAHNDLTIMNNTTLDVDPNITQTITNTGVVTVDSGGEIDWTGTAGNLITLVSDSPGTQWSLVNNGTVTVQYVDVTDSDASGGTAIDATDGTSVGETQNNIYWLWPPTGGGGGGGGGRLILPLQLMS